MQSTAQLFSRTKTARPEEQDKSMTRDPNFKPRGTFDAVAYYQKHHDEIKTESGSMTYCKWMYSYMEGRRTSNHEVKSKDYSNIQADIKMFDQSKKYK